MENHEDRRLQLNSQYEEAMRQINNSEEKHPQLRSMAHNELRRWLDRELTKLYSEGN